MIALSPALFIPAASALLQKDTVATVTSWEAQLNWATRDDHRPADSITSAAFVTHIGYWSYRQGPGVSLWPLHRIRELRPPAKLAAGRRVLSVANPTRRGPSLVAAERTAVAPVTIGRPVPDIHPDSCSDASEILSEKQRPQP